MIYGISFGTQENIEKINYILENMTTSSSCLIHRNRLNAFFRTEEEAKRTAEILNQKGGVFYSTFKVDEKLLEDIKKNYSSSSFLRKNKPALYLKLTYYKVYDTAEEYLIKAKTEKNTEITK